MYKWRVYVKQLPLLSNLFSLRDDLQQPLESHLDHENDFNSSGSMNDSSSMSGSLKYLIRYSESIHNTNNSGTIETRMSSLVIDHAHANKSTLRQMNSGDKSVGNASLYEF